MIPILRYSVKRNLQSYMIETSVGSWPLPRGHIPKDDDQIEMKYYRPTERIHEESLEHNGLYEIRARNSCAGIYNYDKRCFTIARTKFNFDYLFEEYDWNTGRPYGTAVPHRKIEDAPTFRNDGDKLEYLLQWRNKLSDTEAKW